MLSLQYFVSVPDAATGEQVSKSLQEETRLLLRVQTAVELIVVGGLAFTHAGFLDRVMNCGGSVHNTDTDILETNLLSSVYPDQFIVELA